MQRIREFSGGSAKAFSSGQWFPHEKKKAHILVICFRCDMIRNCENGDIVLESEDTILAIGWWYEFAQLTHSTTASTRTQFCC